MGSAATLSAGGIALLDILAPSERTFFLPPAGGWNHRDQILWHQVGMSIRMVTQYTINNDSEPTRADVLYPTQYVDFQHEVPLPALW